MRNDTANVQPWPLKAIPAMALEHWAPWPSEFRLVHAIHDHTNDISTHPGFCNGMPVLLAVCILALE
eukprot:14899333-Alexandrium_andersonii.AAC.1